jgi:hypothetical protein
MSWGTSFEIKLPRWHPIEIDRIQTKHRQNRDKINVIIVFYE